MTNPPPPQNPGDDPATSRPDSCQVKNPNGDCYPTQNLGYVERKGAVPGNRIPNIRFKGYKNLDPSMKTATSGDLQSVQLADFYDPQATKFRILRIVVGARWCGPCNQEADFLVQNKAADDLAPQGAVLISAVVEGMVPGDGATTNDMQLWVQQHALNFTTLVDGDDKFGLYWKADAIPENITVDARSMEILAREAGFSQAAKTQIQTWVDWTKNNPPQQ